MITGKKLRARLGLCMMGMLLVMLFQACLSNSDKVYVDKFVVPPLIFPDFPKLDGAVRNEDGTVTVSGDWIIRLEEYRIKIETTEGDYQDYKRILDGCYPED